MNPSFGRGRGRRLQLGNSSSNSSYLARYGYQSLSEDAVSTDRKEKSSQEKAGLSRLVGAYDDSDSQSESDDEPSRQTVQSGDQPPLPPNPVAMETNQPPQKPGEGQAMDSEVANFLAEINAISSDSPAMDHNDIPLPPGAFIPRDQTAEVMAEKAVQRLQAEEAKAEPKPAKKTSSYSMFVKGGSEQLGEKKSYMSKFTKGGVEVLGLPSESKMVTDVKEEEYELPEAPTSVWQQCQDENTKYIYYWNYVTNEVTWTIPMDYTQYLLLMKEYEDKLARIPDDVRKRLEAKKFSSQNQQPLQNGKKQEKEEVCDPVTVGPQLPPLAEQDSKSSSPSQIVGPQLPSATVDSPKLEDTEKLKSKQKSKSKKTYGPVLPESIDVASIEPLKQEKEVGSKLNPNITEVDMFVSELLKGKDQIVESSVLNKEAKKTEDKDSYHGNGVNLPKNGVKKEGGKEAEEDDFDIDDIDAALELALERKTAELKKLSKPETKDSKPSKSKKHDRRDKDKKKEKHRSDYYKSESRHRHDKSESKHRSESKQKRSSRHNSGEPEEKTIPAESQPKKARLVAAYDEDSDEEDSSRMTPPAESVKQESEKPKEEEEELKEVPVPHLVKVKDNVEDVANIALGKLEFLEVTKKGLSKLQVLLLELQTRFRDWQDGGLDTEYFLARLHEVNRQLEQYEQSAVPTGYSCHWDRRYFYTDEKSGESQWDYPEAKPVSNSVPNSQSEVSSSNEPAIPEVAPPSPKPRPPPPPLPPDEEEPVLYGPQLPPSTTISLPIEEGNLASEIDGEPMAPDSSDEMPPEEPPKPPEEPPKPPELEPSEPLKEALPVFPGEPPPPGTEVLFGLPPPPPPSEPYPGDDETSYSVDHDSPEDADMDVDDPDTPASTDAEDCVTSSHQDYILPSISVSSSSDISSVSHHSTEALESAPVIYRAPQLNVAASSSSISAIPSASASSSVISASSTVAVPPSIALGPAVITSQPVAPAEAAMPSCVPQSSVPIDMFASTTVSEEISSTSLMETPASLPLPPPQPEVEKGQKEKKKKKKDKSISSSSLSLKKKNVSSLVQKWQQVKVQVEEEEKVNEERQMAIRQKLEEWKREQAHS